MLMGALAPLQRAYHAASAATAAGSALWAHAVVPWALTPRSKGVSPIARHLGSPRWRHAALDVFVVPRGFTDAATMADTESENPTSDVTDERHAAVAPRRCAHDKSGECGAQLCAYACMRSAYVPERVAARHGVDITSYLLADRARAHAHAPTCTDLQTDKSLCCRASSPTAITHARCGALLLSLHATRATEGLLSFADSSEREQSAAHGLLETVKAPMGKWAEAMRGARRKVVAATCDLRADTKSTNCRNFDLQIDCQQAPVTVKALSNIIERVFESVA